MLVYKEGLSHESDKYKKNQASPLVKSHTKIMFSHLTEWKKNPNIY